MVIESIKMPLVKKTFIKTMCYVRLDLNCVWHGSCYILGSKVG